MRNSRIMYGAIVGIMVMVACDYVSAKFVGSVYAIPMSVLMGAVAAGYVAKIHCWAPGLTVGIVSSGITFGIISYFSSDIDETQVKSVINSAIPIVALNILFGIMGGYIGCYLAKSLEKRRTPCSLGATLDDKTKGGVRWN